MPSGKAIACDEWHMRPGARMVSVLVGSLEALAANVHAGWSLNVHRIVVRDEGDYNLTVSGQRDPKFGLASCRCKEPKKLERTKMSLTATSSTWRILLHSKIHLLTISQLPTYAF